MASTSARQGAKRGSVAKSSKTTGCRCRMAVPTGPWPFGESSQVILVCGNRLASAPAIASGTTWPDSSTILPIHTAT